jgi:AraC family transcriptional regulator
LRFVPILQLIGALLKRRNAKSVPPSQDGLAAWQVRRVCAYLDDHLAEDVTLRELVGLSTSHFCRAVAVSLGMPLHRWLMGRRVERARQLLLLAPLTVTDVALTCGFASSQHFATAFRRALGVRPTDYRQQRLT